MFPPTPYGLPVHFFWPNLALVFLQVVNFIIAFLFLTETHPHLGSWLDPGLRLGQSLIGYLGGKPVPQREYSYGWVDTNVCVQF